MTLPNFLIIGAMKSGTTVLYQYLKQHPQIYMSPVKETNFFMRDNKDIKEYHTFFQGVTDEQAIGEASPGYFGHQKAYKRIARHLPNAKLIAIFRNPADRAYSHFLMKYRQELHGMDDREILEYFTKIIQVEKDIAVTNQGFYYRHIKKYLELFNLKQIEICFYEDLKSDPVSLIDDIYQFLNVDRAYTISDNKTYYNKGGIQNNKFLYISLNNLRKYLNPFLKRFFPEKINKKIYNIYNTIRNSNLAKPPKLTPEIRQQLIELYREDILQLQNLSDRDLSSWVK